MSPGKHIWASILGPSPFSLIIVEQEMEVLVFRIAGEIVQTQAD